VGGWRHGAAGSSRALLGGFSSPPPRRGSCGANKTPADAELVGMVQDGMSRLPAVDEDAVQTVQIEYVPNAIGADESAVTPTHIGQGQPHVGRRMPPEDYFRLV